MLFMQNKPQKAKRLVERGRKELASWLQEETDRITTNSDGKVLEGLIKVVDFAPWDPTEANELRIDKTLRKLYKTCTSFCQGPSGDGGSRSNTSKWSGVMEAAKLSWPRYRTIYRQNGGTEQHT
jgi:hypothetical protein